MSAASHPMVKCGDCALFVHAGKCKFFDTPAGKAKDRPFVFAPFWVWSDCYSDREQVRAGTKTMCPTFIAKTQPGEVAA